MFNMNFNEAMEYLFKNKNAFIQGNGFSEDTYLTNDNGVITVNIIHESFSWAKHKYNVLLTGELMKQKFRVIEVLNQNSLKYR